MAHMAKSYGPPPSDRLPSATVLDPLLLELGFFEIQQDNARLQQIIAELLVKNQVLRWALQGKGTTHSG